MGFQFDDCVVVLLVYMADFIGTTKLFVDI